MLNYFIPQHDNVDALLVESNIKGKNHFNNEKYHWYNEKGPKFYFVKCYKERNSVW